MADVPAYYEGAVLIRTNAVPLSRTVSFESSTDAHLHVAIPKGGSFTLNQDKTNVQSLTFAKAEETLSVYLASPHSVGEPPSFVVVMKTSVNQSGEGDPTNFV